MTRPPQPAGRFLGAHPRLLAELRRNQEWLQRVCAQLPPPLDAHCLYARQEQETLTLFTDSPAWGARLRFFGPELLRRLGARHPEVRRIQVRVQPSQGPPREVRPAREEGVRRFSAETAALLRETADHLGQTELADALRRLAKAGVAPGK